MEVSMIDNSHDFFVEKERIFGKENYEDNAVRMHRAISWLYACEQHGHDDLGFLSAWIGFNACYSKPIEKIGEHEYFRISSFIGTLIKHDREDLIARYIFQEQQDLVESLMNNQFLFKHFWISVHGDQDDDWMLDYELSNHEYADNKEYRKTQNLCSDILQRIYVLRNQLIHGGATFESSFNRQQIQDCNAFMHGFLIIVIHIMLSNANADWGNINYPPIL